MEHCSDLPRAAPWITVAQKKNSLFCASASHRSPSHEVAVHDTNDISQAQVLTHIEINEGFKLFSALILAKLS